MSYARISVAARPPARFLRQAEDKTPLHHACPVQGWGRPFAEFVLGLVIGLLILVGANAAGVLP